MRRLSLPLLLLVSLYAPCAIGAPLAQVLRQFDRDSHGNLRAVVVLRDGALVAERYYNGQAQDSLHDMRSAGVERLWQAVWPAALGRDTESAAGGGLNGAVYFGISTVSITLITPFDW